MIAKNCLECSKSFQAKISEINRGYGKFCTRRCSSSYNSKKRYVKINKTNVKCSYCEKEFYRAKNKQLLSKSGLQFCCREHKDLAQRIGGIEEIFPSHYTNGNSSSTRYRTIAFREKDAECERCGESEIPSILEVHHKDRNRSNNKIDNLEILCPTCHAKEHYINCDGVFHKNRKKGFRSSKRKLTDFQIRDIRIRYANRSKTGEKVYFIANEYSVSASTITKIINGKTYKDTGL